MATEKDEYVAEFEADAPKPAAVPEEDKAFVADVEAKRADKPAAPVNFSQAFSRARKAGDKTFEFNGKKYTTALKAVAEKPKLDKVSTAGPMEMTNGVVKAERPSVYADNFIKDGVNKIKSKLNERSGSADKMLDNGKPNLTSSSW